MRQIYLPQQRNGGSPLKVLPSSPFDSFSPLLPSLLLFRFLYWAYLPSSPLSSPLPTLISLSFSLSFPILPLLSFPVPLPPPLPSQPLSPLLSPHFLSPANSPVDLVTTLKLTLCEEFSLPHTLLFLDLTLS